VAALTPAIAMADMTPPTVNFKFINVQMQYTTATRSLSIQDNFLSGAAVFLNGDPQFPPADAAGILLGSFYNVNLNATVGSAADGYPIIGTFSATDVTGTTKFLADFNSTNVGLTSAFDGTLIIEGLLSGVNGQSILANANSPWVYEGQLGSDVVVQNPEKYTQGQLIHIAFDVDANTLAEMFDSNYRKRDGKGFLCGSVSQVPVPAAVALGLVGLGMVGWWMRKFA
jgi:hypothetical protein